MGPLNKDNKLQVDEKNNKNWNIWKSLKKYNIIKYKTIQYKLKASGNIIHLIVNYKFMRLVSILRLLKNKKKQKSSSIKGSAKSVKAFREWTFQ